MMIKMLADSRSDPLSLMQLVEAVGLKYFWQNCFTELSKVSMLSVNLVQLSMHIGAVLFVLSHGGCRAMHRSEF